MFGLLKWNEITSRGLDEVAHMTLLFMVACYGCEWNTNGHTYLYLLMVTVVLQKYLYIFSNTYLFIRYF